MGYGTWHNREETRRKHKLNKKNGKVENSAGRCYIYALQVLFPLAWNGHKVVDGNNRYTQTNKQKNIHNIGKGVDESGSNIFVCSILILLLMMFLCSDLIKYRYGKWLHVLFEVG